MIPDTDIKYLGRCVELLNIWCINYKEQRKLALLSAIKNIFYKPLNEDIHLIERKFVLPCFFAF